MGIIKRIIKSPIRKLYKYLTLKVIYPRVYKKYAKQPVDERKVVFVEMRVDKLRNCFHVLYDELVRKYDLEINVHFMQLGFVSKIEAYKRNVALIKDMATAKYIFIAEASNVLGCVKIRRETGVTQLWHGAGAFKKFGLSTAELIFGETKDEYFKYPSHENYKTVTVSAPEVIWAYEEAMDFSHDSGVVKALGVSRSDIFYDKEFINAASEKLKKVIPQSADKKVILYAPTFRGRVASAQAPDAIDMQQLKRELSDEYIILVKHHPVIKELPEIPKECSDFAWDLTNDFSIEELICVADICISDYSSLIFEYSIFEKPMIFFAYDIDDFNDWRGFYYDYDEMTPGPIYTTNEEIIKYIKNIDKEFDKAEVHAFREKFMVSCDGSATKRIIADAFGTDLEQYKRAQPLKKYDYELPKV